MGMAERIKERRLTMGFTQEELAEKLGLQKSAIAKYENGRVENIKRSVIARMADILACSPAYLMGWEEQSKTQDLITKAEQEHLHKYRSIDGKGKHTVDTVLEMEYNRCNKPHLVVNAAHAIEGATEEELQHDDDIMNDDNF